MGIRTFLIGCNSRRERGLRPNCMLIQCGSKRAKQRRRAPIRKVLFVKDQTAYYKQLGDLRSSENRLYSQLPLRYKVKRPPIWGGLFQILCNMKTELAPDV